MIEPTNNWSLTIDIIDVMTNHVHYNYGFIWLVLSNQILTSIMSINNLLIAMANNNGLLIC